MPAELSPPHVQPRRSRPVAAGWLAAAIFLVSLNLRVPVTAVPPLVPVIERDLGLSGAAAGLLTTLPALCMGLFAPFAQRLAHRLGHERAMSWALVATLIGTLLRLGGQAAPLLFLGTFIAGVGIAVGGTVLPGIVKEFFGHRSGLITGLYMGGMMVGGAAASQLAVPVAEWLESWPASLAGWAALALAGLAGWIPVSRRIQRAPERRARSPVQAGPLPWRHATAWLVTIFLVVQSTQFYTQVAWIPATYQARGWTESAAGSLLVIYMLAQGVSGIGGPAWADRLPDLRPLILISVTANLAGIAGVIFAPDWAYGWMTIMGIGVAGGFSLALVLLVRYAATPAASARLTAMAFLVSYTAASLGPAGFGALRDVTGSFEAPWTVLLGLGAVQFALTLPLGPRRAHVR